MCRLFGFRSVIASQVHRSLVGADNALGAQSEFHPDGWGVAYYVDGAPHVTRAAKMAGSDVLFQRLSGVVASETVLAHVRKATQGANNVLNCHPFQHGRWTFAHNGDVPDFAEKRDAFLAHVAPRYRRFILGDTDSEVLFALFLTHLQFYGDLSGRLALSDVASALQKTVALAKSIGDTPEKPALLTFMVTDGKTMAAVRTGKELYFSTYKSRCADRESCPSLAPECEAPSVTGHVNHLLFSSEPIEGENVWIPLEEGEVVGVDWRMQLERFAADQKRALSVV